MIEETLTEAKEKMAKAIEVVREDFASIRAGGASAALFNTVMVDYYGTPTPLPQLAGLQVPEARMVLVSPYDKSAFGDIEKAIRESDLGVNPTNDGNVIRVTFPQLTEERRREFIKVAKNKAEDGKIALRSVRRHAKEALEAAKKAGDVGEDDVHRAEKQLDEITAAQSQIVDDLLKVKETELLEI